VDPALVCAGANEEWDETLQRCIYTLPPVVVVGTKPKSKPTTTGGGSSVPPEQAGMFGGTGAWLLGGAAVGAVLLSIMKSSGVFGR